MVEERERNEIDPLSDEEIEWVRSHRSDVTFRKRVAQEIRRYAGWVSASIITSFALYKAVMDVLFKKGGS